MTRKYDLPSPHKQYVQGQCSDGKGGCGGERPATTGLQRAEPFFNKAGINTLLANKTATSRQGVPSIVCAICQLPVTIVR